MSMMTLKCPKCSAEAKVSFADNNYSGPRRCWKCHEFFTITIENNRVTFCEPLSAEEYQRQQDAKKAAEKGGGGIGFARQGQLEFSQPAADQPPAGAPKEEEVDIFKSLAGKSKGGIDFSPTTPRSEQKATPARDGDLFNSLKSKSGSGTDSSRPAQNTFPPSSPPIAQDFPRPPIPVFPPSQVKPSALNTPAGKPKTYITPSQADPKKPAVFPPDRIRTFVPQEEIKEQPAKPKKKETPHDDRWNSFIPPQT